MNKFIYKSYQDANDFLDFFWDHYHPEKFGKLPSNTLLNFVASWINRYPYSATLKTIQGNLAKDFYYFSNKSPLCSPYVYYTQALKIDPLSSVVYEELGTLFDIDENYEASQKCFNCANRFSYNLESYIELSRVLIQQGDIAKAKKTLEDAIIQCQELLNKLKSERMCICSQDVPSLEKTESNIETDEK
jgi:tetratricopeptide (TPR) repeat protein